MATKPRRMQDSDIRKLRELTGGTTIDLSYLLGSSLISYKMSANKGGDRDIPSRRMDILIRLLTKYPDGRYFPVPEMPDFDEFSSLVTRHWMPEMLAIDGRPGPSPSAGVLGPLLGVNSSAGYNWSHGGSCDKIIERLFWVVSNMIKLEGKEGLAKYIEVVKETALAYDTTLPDVVKARSWGRKDRVNQRSRVQERDA